MKALVVLLVIALSGCASSGDYTKYVAAQYADEYRTDDPLVLGMGYALGKTEEEIRAVFELANSL